MKTLGIPENELAGSQARRFDTSRVFNGTCHAALGSNTKLAKELSMEQLPYLLFLKKEEIELIRSALVFKRNFLDKFFSVTGLQKESQRHQNLLTKITRSVERANQVINKTEEELAQEAEIFDRFSREVELQEKALPLLIEMCRLIYVSTEGEYVEQAEEDKAANALFDHWAECCFQLGLSFKTEVEK